MHFKLLFKSIGSCCKKGSLITILLFIFVAEKWAQTKVSAGEKVSALFSSMSGLHVAPKTTDITFSNEIYSQ